MTRQSVQQLSPSPEVTDCRLKEPLRARSHEASDDLLLVTSLRTDTVSSVSCFCWSIRSLLYSDSPRSFDFERFFLCQGSNDLRRRSSASLLLFFSCNKIIQLPIIQICFWEQLCFFPMSFNHHQQLWEEKFILLPNLIYT